MKKIITSVVILLAAVLLLTACDNPFDKLFGKDDETTVADDTTTVAPETTKTPETTVAPESTHVHAYTGKVTDPTCSEDGFTTYTCACGDTYKGDVVPKTGNHAYADWIVTVKATCVSAGEERRVCTSCGLTDARTVAVDKNAHTFVEKSRTEPTATEAGKIIYECSSCHTTKTETNGFATGSLGLEIKDGVILGIGNCTDRDIIINNTDVEGKPITAIAEGAFFGTNIKSVSISASVTSIGNIAFAGCYDLTTINVSADNSAYMAKDNVLYTKDGKTLVAVPAGYDNYTGEFVFDENVEKVMPGALADCPYIEKYVLSDAMIANGYSLILNGALAVTDTVVMENNGEEEETEAEVLKVTTLVAYPTGGIAENKATSFKNNELNTYFNIAEVVTGDIIDYKDFVPGDTNSNVRLVFGDYAFLNCKAIYGITTSDDYRYTEDEIKDYKVLPDLTVGKYAFAGCENLLGIVIPEGVEYIGDAAFEGCTRLMNVTVPDSVIALGDYAFAGCTGLEEVVFGSDVDVTAEVKLEKFGKEAFYLCTSLKRVFFKGTSYEWADIQEGEYGSVANLEIYLASVKGNEGVRFYCYESTLPTGISHLWKYDTYGAIEKSEK